MGFWKRQAGFCLGATAFASACTLATLPVVAQMLSYGGGSSIACRCFLLTSEAGGLREVDGGEVVAEEEEVDGIAFFFDFLAFGILTT